MHGGLFGRRRAVIDPNVPRDQFILGVGMGALVLRHEPPGPRVRAVIKQQPVNILIRLVFVIRIRVKIIRS